MSSRWTPQDLANYQARRRRGLEIVTAPKPNKYGAKKTEVDGIVFDSKREATRYQDLKYMEAAGEISDLQRQIIFPLVVNDVKIGLYIADFQYKENGEQITEDSKGVRTRDYVMKRRLMLALYGIHIRET